MANGLPSLPSVLAETNKGKRGMVYIVSTPNNPLIYSQNTKRPLLCITYPFGSVELAYIYSDLLTYLLTELLTDRGADFGNTKHRQICSFCIYLPKMSPKVCSIWEKEKRCWEIKASKSSGLGNKSLEKVRKCPL